MDKNKLIVLIFLGMFLISLASALDNVGVGKQNQNFTFCQTCSDATYITISTIQLPDRTVLPINTNMTASGSSFCYNITTTSQLGRYDITGLSNGCENTYATYFEITYSGGELSTGNSIFYAVLIVLMILLLAGTLYGTTKLPDSDEKGDDGRIMSINWLKYLKAPLMFVSWMIFIAILYISSNLAFAYLGEQLFAKIIFVLFRICFGITPIIVIVWVISFFVQFFKDKKFQSLINRGIFPQGKI